MFLVQVFRPEALPEFDGATEEFEYRRDHPFDGVEILGFCDTEDEVNTLIDSYYGRGWHFHYEELPESLLSALRGN
jgi:hypothetical protein